MKRQIPLSAPLVAGAVLVTLGAINGLGWVLQIDFLARVLPGGSRAGIVNPLLFIIIGLCFLEARSALGSPAPSNWTRHLAAFGIGLLHLLPLGYLFESLTGIPLGIDIVRAGVVATVANPNPGRISPNASVAFLLTGVALWLMRKPLVGQRRLSFVVCTFIVALVGFAGLAGHLLGLEALYKIADFNRILPTTAFGFLVAGAGLWALLDQSQPFEVGQAQERIQRRALAVCALVAVSCGIAGFSVMRDTFEQSLSRNMLLTATTTATSLGHTIDVSLWFPRTVATRPTVTQTLERLSRDSADSTSREFLQKIADSFLTAGLSGVEFYNAQGVLVVTAGSTMREKAQVVHPLRNAGQTASLAWDGSYVLLTDNPVLSASQNVGRVRTEQRMPLIDQLLLEVRSADETSDAVLCSKSGDKAVCAATRFRTPSFELPLQGAQGQVAEAVGKALAGERGVLSGKDPRGMAVLAAYAPIKDFGLGFGVKTDVNTLYAPLRPRFASLVGALLAIIALAFFALRSQIQPALVRLVESERKMTSILEEQSELVCLAQPDGKLLYVNPAFSNHFEMLPAQMVGRNLFEFVEPADRKALKETIAGVLHSGVAQDAESRMLTVAGARWVAWTNRMQRDSALGPLLHSVGRDVTERKQAEKALAASRAVLERTGRVAAVGGWELDLRTQALYWTDETRRIHEVADDFVPSLDSAIAFYAPEGRTAVVAAVEHGMASGAAWDLELPLITAKGRNIWVRAQGQVESENGNPVRLVGAFQDITERKTLEQRLADNERFIRKVTDNLPVRIAYVDREARFRFVNLAHCQRFGLPREEIIGRTRTELMNGLVDADVNRAISAVLSGTEQRVEFEEVLCGKTVRIESRMVPDVGEDGLVKGFFTTGIDITERAMAERALRDLTTIFDNTTDYVVQADWRGRVLYMNPAARQALGMVDADMEAQHSFAEFNTPQTNQMFADVIVPAVKAHGVWVGETTVYVAGRKVVPVNHMVIAQRGPDGRINRYSAIMRDISEEVAAKRETQRQAATLRSVTEAIPAIVSVVGADGRYRFANSSFERWSGTKRSDIIGRTLQEVLGRIECERSLPWVKKVLAGETVSFEQDFPSRANARHLSISYVPLWLATGEVDGFVSVGQDITRHKVEEVRLLHLTQRDGLTGLLNRSGFEQFLNGAMGDDGSVQSLALLYVDLDHFKPVNDMHGHPVGDQVLQQFANRLSNSVRPTDAVARFGGDEFAIALTGVRERSHAQAIADKVVAAAREPFTVGALTLQVGACVGVAFGTETTTNWQELVAHADAMLYRAKAAGRGQHAGIV